jgi:hypothetical protein
MSSAVLAPPLTRDSLEYVRMPVPHEFSSFVDEQQQEQPRALNYVSMPNSLQ